MMEIPEWYTLKSKGMRWQRFKQPARAIDCLTRSLELMRKSAAPIIEIANTLNYLAFVYLQDNQLSQAEVRLREALECVSQLPTEQRHLAAEDFMMLATVLSRQGRHQEAVEAGQHGLELHQSRDPKSAFVKQIRERVKQLKRNLADAEKKERRSLRSPSRTL